MPDSALRLNGVVETALYVDDLRRAREFYESVFGLDVMFHDDRVAAYPVGANVFLLFQRGTTNEPATLPGGTIPPHDGSGRLHFAFAISADSLEQWRQRLADREIVIEGEVHWPRGACSLYFRDPDQHLVELVTPGIWANY